MDGQRGWSSPTRSGEPLVGSRITEQRLRPVLKRAGLPLIRFHDLRHTATTLMLTAGVHPKVVSEMLGHSSVAITLDRYSQEEAAPDEPFALGSCKGTDKGTDGVRTGWNHNILWSLSS
jgi:integrase